MRRSRGVTGRASRRTGCPCLRRSPWGALRCPAVSCTSAPTSSKHRCVARLVALTPTYEKRQLYWVSRATCVARVVLFALHVGCSDFGEGNCQLVVSIYESLGRQGLIGRHLELALQCRCNLQSLFFKISDHLTVILYSKWSPLLAVLRSFRILGLAQFCCTLLFNQAQILKMFLFPSPYPTPAYETSGVKSRTPS